jgi:hypothetical protein
MLVLIFAALHNGICGKQTALLADRPEGLFLCPIQVYHPSEQSAQPDMIGDNTFSRKNILA